MRSGTKTKARAAAARETAGQRLARLRRQRGVTQRELAESLGVDQSVISNYERGARRLHGDVLIKIGGLLGVTSDEILGFKDVPNEGIEIRRRFLKRLQDVDRLSEREQRALLQTIDAFLERARMREKALA